MVIVAGHAPLECGWVLASSLGAGLSTEGKVFFNAPAKTRCTILVVGKALNMHSFPVLYFI